MIQSLEKIAEVELKYTGGDGEPTLGMAFDMYLERWNSGCRDKETCLRLCFLSWYSCSEPPAFTGLFKEYDYQGIFTSAFDALGGVESTDIEVCCVIGLMADLFPYCIGEESFWQNVSAVLKSRVGSQVYHNFDVSVFIGRGAYGEYFYHMFSKMAQSS